jgi:putative transcriptional regulator
MNKNRKTIRYNRIKVELTDVGKQSKELAKYLGVTPSTVSDWCTNTNQPSIQVLYKISEFLKINVRDLLVPTSWVREAEMTQAAEDGFPLLKKQEKKTKKTK